MMTYTYHLARNRCFMAIVLMALSAVASWAQRISDVRVLPQQDMSRWHVAGANYSGITHLGADRYAVVSDKETMDGFYVFTIRLDSVTGKVMDVVAEPMMGIVADSARLSTRDQEGIAYVAQRNSVFISGEGDQRIIEHSLDGHQTGCELAVPVQLGTDAIYPNYGFEALCFSPHDGLFWTMTELTLKADGRRSTYQKGRGAEACLLRLQAFGADLLPARQYAYRTDGAAATATTTATATTASLRHSLGDQISENSTTTSAQPSPTTPKPSSTTAKSYASGVVALTALSDGSLLVLEREFYVAPKYIGSWVRNKIYHVRLADTPPVTFDKPLSELPDTAFVQKELVAEFKTSLNLTVRNLANYEGMCLGPQLTDGRQTLLLISDSQANYGNNLYRMKDYIRVVTFRYSST